MLNHFSKRTSLLLAVIICSLNAWSQSVDVSGKITDKRSNAIEAATVSLLNTNFITVTDAQGNFIFHHVAKGNYSVQVKAIGYAVMSKDIQVNDAQQNIALQLQDALSQLDEVLVTAQKKEERLQKAPLSISALSDRQINEYRLWNSKDITAIVPNLYAANPGDGRNVTSIRGITSTSYDPAVTTYVDGVNQFSLDTYIPQLFDVESIEVLRGPQGTLYGRNAMGGVINIITKKPSNKTDAFAEITIGNYGQQRYTAGVRTALIKNKLFFGAAGLYEKLDGYYTNELTNSNFDKQHSLGGNYYLKYLPADHWSITLNAKHMANRNDGSFPLAGSTEDAFANPFKLSQNAIGKLVDNVFNSSLAINYSGTFNFSSQTAYQSNYRYYASPIDGDFSPIDGVTVINDYGKKWNNVKVLTEEFKFSSRTSASSKLKWTAGSYLFYQKVPNKQATHFGADAIYVGSPDTNYAIINTTEGKNFGAAVYGQATYNISKQFELIAGLRYDYEHKKQEVHGEYKPDASPDPVFDTQPDTSASVSYNAVSPMLSLAYHINEQTNIYITYSRGYRTGGLTQLSADPSQPPLYQYKPEYSNDIEAGIKNNLFNNHLHANIAVFFTNITNAQVPTLILPDAITVTKNAGKLTSKGFDAEFAAVPVRGLEATWNFGYTDAKYKTLKLSQNGEAVDLAGKRQVYTPDITSMLALQYSIAVNSSRSLKIVLRGEWMYLGDEYFDLSNNIHQSPYSLFNTRFGVTTKHFELMLWGRNLTDKKYIAYAYDFGAVHLGNPYTYGVTAKVKL